MKREGRNHPKFKLVARDLRLPMCYVVGILESIWGVAGEKLPKGDIGRWSNEEIAAAIDYPGDTDELIKVLRRRRLLDDIPEADGRLYIHDWHEHADAHIHAQLAKRGLYFANGAEPQIPHDLFNNETRARIKAEYDKRRTGRTQPRVELPEPTPEQPEQFRDESGTIPGQVRTCPGQVPPMPEPEPEPVLQPETDSNREPELHAPFPGHVAESIRPIELGRSRKRKPRPGPATETAGSVPVDQGRIRTAIAEYCPVSENDTAIIPRVVAAARDADPAIRGETLELVVHACIPPGHPGIESPAWFERTVPDFIRSHSREYQILRGLSDPAVPEDRRGRAAQEYLSAGARVSERERRCAGLALLQIQGNLTQVAC